ncbi:MAG: hypothetical protein NC489_09130 [Ruminococcus flavefaciens]|nr:hypothetical protein [Ruminococcus flavefaciens]
MSVDVRAMLLAKKEEKKSTGLVMKDVNRDLITSLLAISVYGKDARDEEILSVIINAGANVNPLYNRICAAYEEKVKSRKVTKGKDGVVRDTDGFAVLVPKS